MGGERSSKRRKSLDSPPDLISDLPRGVLDCIIQYLPLRDAARLCILSSKWRDIWISTPQLVLDFQFFFSVLGEKLYLTHKFSSIVSKILFQHDGPISKFSLYVPALDECLDVTEWLSFLSRSGIRDFSLQNRGKSYLKLSSHLFFCVGLERLNLHRCILSPPLNFKGFRKLVSLELLEVTFEEGRFKHLISSCPLLENLNLTNCKGIQHVNIDALSLTHLIVIGTFKSLSVQNVENLLSAKIDLALLVKSRRKTRDLIEVLANSRKLEKLCLGDQFCKVLFRECLIPTTFGHLRSLELSSIHLDSLNDFSSAVRAIQACPNIEKLDISFILFQVNTSNNMDIQMLDYCSEIPRLRRANVGLSSASTMELKLIEFLLACSPVLEILSLSFIRPITECFQLRMSQQLIRFRRASPKAEVICPEAPPSITRVDSSDSSSDSDSSSAPDDTSSSTSSGDTESSSSSDSASSISGTDAQSSSD